VQPTLQDPSGTNPNGANALSHDRLGPIKAERMNISSRKYRVPPRSRVDLRKWPTRSKQHHAAKTDYEALLHEHVAQVSKQQSLLYADNRHALLLIFQGMDTSGKDGAIKHVMSGVNPQGCQVFSFKHPSSAEQQHDFLWRTTRDLPERGRIGIFNRSYYEEVLITRVHQEILEGEKIPEDLIEKEILWEQRYKSIRGLEQHLSRNGTQIVKFFLHVSKEEQRRRLLARIDEPQKNWKFNLSDVLERKCWKQYRKAYEACLSATSTRHAPWYVVPADDKPSARLIISQVIIDTLKALKLAYPKSNARRRKELQAMRSLLAK
jgi:PPK2 family polyphosphate:nucleotide phosphotransferase